MSDAEGEPEHRSGYEGWLDELAGERVSTLPIFLVWALLVGVACAVGYLAGLGKEFEFTGVTAVVSVPYWLLGVPNWLKRRRRQRNV
jgi:hypothetical protein